MVRLMGMLKVSIVIAVDALILFYLIRDVRISAGITGCIVMYVLLGGYIEVFKEGAVRMEQLPSYEKNKLEIVKKQLMESVQEISGMNISSFRFYLTPSEDMNAAAYGANCVSVTRAALENTDPITLEAVVAHEVSHIISYDAEFNRAVFATITMTLGIISMASFVTMIIVFLICFVFGCFFRSYFGIMAYRGIQSCFKGVFCVIQRIIVVGYFIIIGAISRHNEYRADYYSCRLGYGLQLANFLELAAPESSRKFSLTEVLYRSHPPTPKRLAKIEKYINNSMDII